MRGERIKPYAEDSTRGGSIINPLNYKGDVLVQVWVDSRVLATLCGWLDEKGTYARYMSQVVRRPLEVLVDLLANSGDATLIDNTVEARNLLEKRFGIDLNRGGRGTKNAMHNIELSIRREDLSEVLQREDRVYDVRRPLRSQNPTIAAKVEEARRRYRELYPDENGIEQIVEIDKEKKVYDDTKVVVRGTENEILERNKADETPLRERGNSRELVEARIRAADEESKKQLDELNSFDPLSLIGSAVKGK